ncbi:MAG TPA: cytochrome c biogenesis protein CcsA [Holophagaceae bacterium]|nr:cytochrome c biogenesis protein CcsA [Holophagaceae bacterium]
MPHLVAQVAKAALPFQLALAAFALAFLATLASLWLPAAKDPKDRAYASARVLFLAGLALNAYLVVDLGLDSGRPPIKTHYESMLFFALLLGLLVVLLDRLRKVRILGAMTLVLILAALGFALHRQDIEAAALPASLNSGWFLPHATLAFGGYASASVALFLALLALRKPAGVAFEPGSFWGRALGAEDVDFVKLHRQWLRLGFLLLLAGLATGALWARSAWAEPWSWDPKQSWTLVTLLVYGAVLHMHHTELFKGRKALWASVLAWAFILMTTFGVGFLPTRSQSMHLYSDPPAPADAKDVKGIHPEMY